MKKKRNLVVLLSTSIALNNWRASWSVTRTPNAFKACFNSLTEIFPLLSTSNNSKAWRSSFIWFEFNFRLFSNLRLMFDMIKNNQMRSYWELNESKDMCWKIVLLEEHDGINFLYFFFSLSVLHKHKLRAREAKKRAASKISSRPTIYFSIKR